MIPENQQRGNFGGKVGFILAAAGSAIGLGNIWRFPYTAGEHGGGAFVLVYLAFVVLVGIPVLLAELSIGRASQRNPVGAFRVLAPRTWWPAVGALGVVTGFAILAFYSVVAGWTVGYLVKAMRGDFAAGITASESAAQFQALIGNPGLAIALTAVFMVLTVGVIQFGVGEGIERFSKVLMPAFFVLLLLLAGRSLTLPGAGAGLRFLFHFDPSQLTIPVIMGALGQALFSLSLGMGCMITYGSYLPRRENLPFAAVSVAFFDTLIALLAGIIIFPALFTAGADPAGGAGLVFIAMPTVFDSLPAGQLFAVAFYALLAIAALTSTISLLEVVVAYFVDEKGWPRAAVAWGIGFLCFLLAIPSALSQGAVPALSGGEGSLLPLSFLDLNNILFGNYGLTFGSLLISLFVGWKWGTRAALEEMKRGAGTDRAWWHAAWAFLVRFVCPVAIVLIFVFILWTGEYF